jgi:uncharacterized membrane protein YphA (DoxX/SURF4 family)
MAAATLVARLVLAALFAVAGAAKLADRDDARRTLRGFEVPDALVAPLALLVPAAELATAAALIASPTVVAGALGALVLLAVFSGAVAVAVGRGREVECGCFGRLYAAMVSRRTLARNAALAAVAGFVLARALSAPATSATDWIADLSGWQVAALSQGALCWQLLRQNGRLWTALHDLERRLKTEVPA